MDLTGTRKFTLPANKRSLLAAYELGLTTPEQTKEAERLLAQDEDARALAERARERLAKRRREREEARREGRRRH
jgi:anti-sigma-K factor RskA